MFFGSSSIILGVLGAAVFVVLPGHSHASTADLRPSWLTKRASPSCITPNVSYLNDYEFSSDRLGRPITFMDEELSVLDPGTANSFKQPYADMTRDYDMRERAAIVDRPGEQSYFDRMKGFANDVFGRISKFQEKQGERIAKVIGRRQPRLQEPAKVVVAAAGLYVGRQFEIKLNDSFKLNAFTELRNLRGGVGMESSYLLNSSISFLPMTPNYNASAPPALDPGMGNERYRISVSRGIPYVNVNTGLSYGSTTSTLTASMSKQLSSHWVCEVGSIKPVLNPDKREGQDVVQFKYQLNF